MTKFYCNEWTSGKRLDRSARMRVYLAHFAGLKRLLVTIALLSAATCTVDVPKLKDVSATGPDHRVTPSHISGARLGWNRGERNPVKHSAPSDNDNDDSALAERTGKSSESPRAFGIRYSESPGQRMRRRIRSNNVKAKHARRDGPCPSVGAALTTFRNSLEENHHLTLCNTTECRYRLLRQGWKVHKTFYAEEPSWIDIDEDYGETHRYRDRLDTIDPFVVARRKKIGESSDRHVVDGTKGVASIVVGTSCDGAVVNGKAETGTSMPSKCDINAIGTDRFGGAAKRTRAEDGRAILLDILSMSDPFYAARGKRQNTVTGIPLRQLRARAEEFNRPGIERHRYILESYRFPLSVQIDESK